MYCARIHVELRKGEEPRYKFHEYVDLGKARDKLCIAKKVLEVLGFDFEARKDVLTELKDWHTQC